MSTSFDNLVARKGSPSHSLRSGSTQASASNMSETRDISRQSAQRARVNHRRAIQARKVVFLVLILLLILGGLSYAIYRVVSNDSGESESEKVRLENDGKTTIQAVKTSSTMLQKVTSIRASMTTLTSSRKKGQQHTAVQDVTTTISTLPQAPPPRASSIVNSKSTPSGQASVKQTSSVAEIKNAISSSLSSETPGVETTKIIDKIVKTTSNVIQTSQINSESSIKEDAKRLTSTASPQYQNTEISSDRHMEATKSMEKSKSSVVTYLSHQSHTVDNIPNVIPSSVLNMKHVSPSSTIPGNHQMSSSIEKETASSNPIEKIKTRIMVSSKSKTIASETPQATETSEQNLLKSTVLVKHSTTSETSTHLNSLKHLQMTKTTKEMPSSVLADMKSPTPTSVSSSSSLHSLNKMSDVFTLKNQMSTSTLSVDMVFPFENTVSSESSSDSTNILHAQPSHVPTLSSHSTFFTDNFIPHSSSVTPSKLGQVHSTVTETAEIFSSVSKTEKTPKLNSSAAGNAISSTVLLSISPTRSMSTPLKTSNERHLDTNNISTSIHLKISGIGTYSSISSNASHVKIQSIQPTKTSLTPVVSSSVWTPPYYHPWSNWSECSRDCGGGYAHQTRNCSQDGQCDHLGPSVNTTICNLKICNETTFDVSVNLTDFEWTDDFYNTTSQAYMELVKKLMEELRALYGPNVSIEIKNISQGSVIVTFTITFHTSNDINNLTYAISEGNIGNLSVSLVKIVNNMVPRKPGVILIQNVTTNSTMIHWSSIQSNESNGILLGYKVMITPGNMNLTLDDKTTSANFDDLNPDTEYIVSILGYNVNGDGEIKSATFRTQELPPHFLPWGAWSNCTRDCGGGLTSRNRSCSKEGMCSHLGDYTQTEHCNVKKCNETSFDVGLNMTNIDWTDDLQNTSSPAYQKLLAELIAELQKLYPNATIELGTITKGSVIFNFKITLPVKTTTTIESFSNNLEGNGLGNYTTKVKSIEDTNLPKVPPGSINVTMVTHHSALINWLPISEKNSNGAILGYKIILMNGTNKTNVFNVTARASDTEFNHELQMLEPNTTYQFKIYGYNINGDGPKSEMVYFTTKVQIPKIVSANVTLITTTQALFSWQKIQNNNKTYGIIIGYKIVVRHNHQAIMNDEVSSSESEFQLSDLLPNTNYSITVLGHNHYGDGVISNMFNFTTRVQIPKVLAGNISHITKTGGVFSWSRIPDSRETYGLISGYKIHIICEDQHTRNMTVSRNESRIELSDLHAGKNYNLTIYGFNEYGEGMVSDVVQFKTRDMIPKPNGVDATNITLTTARLNWNAIPPSEESYGSIDGYNVIVSHGSLTNTTIVRNATSIVLRNISSNTTYCFQIVAFNEFGDGNPSNVSCFTTLVEEKHDEMVTSTVAVLKPSVTQSLLKTELQTHEHPLNITVTPSITMHQHPFSSVFTNSTNQEGHVSSIVPSLPPTPSSTFAVDEIKSSNTAAEAEQVSTVAVQPSTTITKQNIQTSSAVLPTTRHPTTKQSTTEQSTTTQPTTEQSTTPTTKQSTTPTTKQSTTPTTKHTTPPKTSPTTEITSPSTKPITQKVTSDLNSLSNKSEPTSTTPVEVAYIVGKIKLTSKTFETDLNDPESESFKALASKMKASLERLFRADGLQFERIEVLGFSKGSVVVDFYVVTLKSMEYETANFTVVLVQAVANGGQLDDETFEFSPNDFSTVQAKPTIPPTNANEANKGLQKNEDEDDSAMIVAVVICVLLIVGVLLVVLFIGKKKNWFGKRSKRKVLPEDDDDDDDDLYPSPAANDTVRLKTARSGRRSHGARINGGHSTTEC